MPTIEELGADLARSTGEITQRYTDLSARLTAQEAALAELKRAGASVETPPAIANAIAEVERSLGDHSTRVTEIKAELATLVATAAQMTDVVERLDSMEKAAQRAGIGLGANGGDVVQSLGAQFVDLVRANANLFGGRDKIKGVPSLAARSFEGTLGFSGASLLEIQRALGSTATPNFIPVQQLPGYIPLGRRRLRIRDIMPMVTTEAQTIRYLRQTGFTTSATNAVTGITRSGNVVTVVQAGHGYRNFDLVKIAGANQTDYNNNWRITVVDANTFTFKIGTTPTTPATGTIVARRMNNYGAASYVAEGAAKPSAEMFFDEREAKVVVLAHYIKIYKQVMDDLPGLRSKIDGELVYGLLRREEEGLLYGTGTNNQIQGIMTDPDIQTYLWSQGKLKDTKADAIRRGATLVELADFESTAAVIHPVVWEEIELEKGSDGHYIWVRDQNGINGDRIWKMPLVVTPAISYENYLQGAFAFASRLYDREVANVRFSDQNEDDFIKNTITLLGEERLAAVWERPEAFVKGTYDAAPS